MDDMGIDEDYHPNRKTKLIFKFRWSGKQISHYEDAVEAVKGIEDGKFDKAFHQLYPTASLLNAVTFSFADVEDDLLERLAPIKAKYNADLSGAWICLLLEERLASDPDTSTVHFPSIEALITKGSKRKPRQKEPEYGRADRDILRDGNIDQDFAPYGNGRYSKTRPGRCFGLESALAA